MPASGTGARYQVSVSLDPSGIQQGVATGAAAFASLAQAGVAANQLILQSGQAISTQLATQAAAAQSLAGVTSGLASQISVVAGAMGTEASVSVDAATGVQALAVGQMDASASAVELASSLNTAAASATESAAGSLEAAAGGEALSASFATVAAAGAELSVIHEELASTQVLGIESTDELAASQEVLTESLSTSSSALAESQAAMEGAASGNATLSASSASVASSQAAVAESVTVSAEALGSVAGVSEAAAASQESLAASSESITVANEGLAASSTGVVAATEGIASSSESASSALAGRAAASESAVASSEALASTSAAVAEAQGVLAASADAVAVADERAASGAASLASIQEGLSSIETEAASIQQSLSASQSEGASTMAVAAAGAAALVASTSEVVVAQQGAAVVAAESAAAETELLLAQEAEAAAALAAAAAAAAAAEAEARRTASAAALQGKLDQLVLTVDAEAAAEQRLTAAEHLLDEAVQAGLIDLARQNELLDLAKDKFAVAGEEAESVGAKVGEMAEMVKGLAEVLLVFEAFDFFKESVSSASKFNVSLAQINASLASTHDASGMTSQGLVEIAEHLEDTTNYSHTAALGMENLLLNFKAIKGEDTFARVSQDVADLAAKMGSDLPQAAVQLGRVIETGTVTSLKRIGVVFSDTEQASIKSMHAMGNEAGVLQVVLKGVEGAVAGQAAAVRDSGTGMQAFKNTLEATQETIGGAMLPAVRGVAAEMQDWLKTNHDAATSLGSELGGAVKVAGESLLFLANNWDLVKVAIASFAAYKTTEMLISLAGAIKEATVAMAAFDVAADANPLGLVVAGIAALVTVCYLGRDAENELAAAEAKRVKQAPEEHAFLDKLRDQTTDLTAAQHTLLEAYMQVDQAAYTAANREAEHLKQQIEDLKGTTIAMGAGAEAGSDSLSGPDQAAIDKLTGKLKTVQEEASRASADLGELLNWQEHFNDQAAKGGDASGVASAGAQKLADTVAEMVAKFDQVTSAQDAESNAIGQSVQEYNNAAAAAAGDKAVLELLKKAQSDKTIATQDEIDAVREAAETSVYATQANKAAQEVAVSNVALDNARAASVAKITDAQNQNNVASTMQSAMSAAYASLQSKKISADSDEGRQILANADAKARDAIASSAQVAAIKDSQQYTIALRTAEAAFADATSQSTVASSQLTIRLKAEAEAHVEAAGKTEAEYQAVLKRNILRAQEIQSINALATAERELTATFDAGNKVTAQTADMVQLSDVTSRYGDSVAKLLQQYGQLDSTSHRLQLEEQIRAAQANANSAQERQDIATQLTLQDEFLQGLRAQEAVVAANIQLQKDWDSAVSQSDQQFLTQLNTMIETGKVNWQTFAKNLEDIWLKSIEQMVADGRAADIVGSLTSGSISTGQGAENQLSALQSNMLNAAHGLITAANSLQGADNSLQSAATSLQSAGTTLQSAGASLGGTAPAISASAAQSSGAITAASTASSTAISSAAASSASTDTAATSNQSGLFTSMTSNASASFEQLAGTMNSSFAQVTGELQACSVNLNTSAGDLITAAGDLAASSQSGGGGGTGNILGNLLNQGGGGAASSGTFPDASQFDGSFTSSTDGINLVSGEQAASAGDSFGLAAGGAFSGLLTGAAALFAAWVVTNIITGWSDSTEGQGFVFGQQFGIGGIAPGATDVGGVTGIQQGAAGTNQIFFDQQSQQVSQGLESFFATFEKATGTFLTKLPSITIQVSADGHNFETLIGGKVVGLFKSIGDAVNFGIDQGLKSGQFANLSKVVQDYIAGLSSSTITDPNKILSDVAMLQQITDGAHGAVSKITTDMQGYITTTLQEDAALVNMNLSSADLTTMLGQVNSGIVALDTQERDSIIGKKLTAKQQQELDRETYNNALDMQEAQLRQAVIQLQMQGLAVAGNGAYIDSLGNVVAATVVSAKALDDTNKALLGQINQIIQSDQGLEKQIDALKIKPGDLKNPAGSSASSSVTTLASAAQALAQSLLSLQQFGMLPFDAAVLKIETDTKLAEKGLKSTSAAYKDLEASEQAQIDLLKKQTQAQTDSVVTPLIEQAHGMSTFAIGLAGIHTQFDAIYKTEQDLGAGSKELARVRAAEAQAERNLIDQVVGGLNLPLDASKAEAQKYAVAIEALNQGLKDGVISLADFNSEMQQIAQQGTSVVLTMIEGIYTAIGDSKDAEQYKEELQQIDFQIKLAQLEEETQLLLAQGVITQALADQVSNIEAHFADPANQPNWALINQGAASTSSANNSLASSATNAADALKAFAQSLTQNSQLTALTPMQQLQSAQAYYQQTTAAAEAGDQTALGNEQAAAQAYLTALRAEYGSAGPYGADFQAVIQTLEQLAAKFGTGGLGTGNTGAIPGASGYVIAYGPNGTTSMVPTGTSLGPGWSFTPPSADTSGQGNTSTPNDPTHRPSPHDQQPPPTDPATVAAQAAAVALNATATAGQQASTALLAVANAFHSAHIPGFAAGGIVYDRRLAFVGEGGPEAIIPLAGGSVPVTLSGNLSGNQDAVIHELQMSRVLTVAELRNMRSDIAQLAAQNAALTRQVGLLLNQAPSGRYTGR